MIRRMVSHFLTGGGLAPSPAFVPRIPDGQRVYAIGDIHGHRDLLKRLMDRIRDDAAPFKGRITLVFIGDYIDRGPDSAGVIDLLLHDLPEEWEFVFLRGNHEQAMLDFIDFHGSSETKGGRFEWLRWGGTQTLASYNLDVFGPGGLRNPLELTREFVAALSQRGHDAFFRQTKLQHVIGNYLFVHAGVRPAIRPELQMPQDVLFIREDFMGRPHELPFRVVFGHTIVPDVLVAPDRIGIDTGAYADGKLSAVALEKTDVRVLQVS